LRSLREGTVDCLNRRAYFDLLVRLSDQCHLDGRLKMQTHRCRRERDDGSALSTNGFLVDHVDPRMFASNRSYLAAYRQRAEDQPAFLAVRLVPWVQVGQLVPAVQLKELSFRSTTNPFAPKHILRWPIFPFSPRKPCCPCKRSFTRDIRHSPSVTLRLPSHLVGPAGPVRPVDL
jgi:hypothetical protein